MEYKMELYFDNVKATVSIFFGRSEIHTMHRYHTHDSYELYFLVEGKRYLHAANNLLLVREGDVFLIPPGMEHRTLDCDGAYTKFVCMIPSSLLPDGVLPTDDLYIVRPTDELRELIYRLAKTARESAPLGAYAAVMSLLSTMLSLPEHKEDARTLALGRMSEIIGYIERNYTKEIKLDALSERFFISEYYLCRLFKEYTGRTIIQYITALRIGRARQMLLSGNTRISKVARDCGFGSVSTFGTAFRSIVGCSPREYRKRNEASK